jgi:radical SAM/Cys-rich protein
MHPTLPLLEPSDFPPLTRAETRTLQANLGYRCNQQCLHCHVNAGPKRSEVMDGNTVDTLLRALSLMDFDTLDLTGGAPELNPHFRRLVEAARGLGIRVIDRCNLTILNELDQDDLAEFLARNRVEITASLPCYLEENVDGQRGKGVFGRSIAALRRLNRLGYGNPDSGLPLNLVYNPTGPSLPPPQCTLEASYRRRLGETYGIVFTHLLTLTNMPIQRFGSTLISRGQFRDYMDLLKTSYNPATLDEVMCRHTLSVDWQGRVYDCDFNQMLGLPLRLPGQDAPTLAELLERNLAGNPVVVRDHCYGCTAGQGSSCGGALAG